MELKINPYTGIPLGLPREVTADFKAVHDWLSVHAREIPDQVLGTLGGSVLLAAYLACAYPTQYEQLAHLVANVLATLAKAHEASEVQVYEN